MTLSSDDSKYVPPSRVDQTFSGSVGASQLPIIGPNSSSCPKPTIAIMSLGEMGMGIAALLTKYSYPVITNLDGRSAKTKARVEAVGIKHLPLKEMLEISSVFLSILPPAEAYPMAQLVAANMRPSRSRKGKLAYIDLNATSPSLSRKIANVITGLDMMFIDGAILGFPPRQLDDGMWFRPAITLSGPNLASINEPWTQQLSTLLNVRHVGADVSAASGLKMCFGAIYKGHAAITIQAYTTAKNLGVLPALREHMEEYFPGTTLIIENSLIGSQRKAYRWIKEMEEIKETFAQEGGWGRDLFHGVSEVFHVEAYQTNLDKDSKVDVDQITEKICVGLKRRKSL